MTDTTTQTPTCPKAPRACLRRVSLGVVAALVLGVGFAGLGGYVVGDFASVSEPRANKTYLVSMPDDEDMLRDLSQQLMTSQAGALSEIAPAAGTPLGTLGE